MFGHTIKYIRTAKNLKQAYVATNAGITQGTYSKFEKNLIDIRSTSFLQILHVLDIPLQEFIYIHQQLNKQQTTDLIMRFFQSPYNNEHVLLELKKTYISLLESNEQSPILAEIVTLCDALLIILQKNDLVKARKLVQPIWDRLSTHNELFLYDIYLVNAMLFIFPLEDVLQIKHFIERNILKYEAFPNVKRLHINLYLNISVLCISNKNYTLGIEMIDHVLEEAKQNREYIKLAIGYIRKGICYKHLANELGDEFINRGRSLLQIIEEHDTLTYMDEELLLLSAPI